MSENDSELSIKNLPDMLVASTRFRGAHQDLWWHLEKLLSLVGSRASGKPLCLRHGGDAQSGFDLEICLPISDVEGPEPLKIRILEGGPMVCTLHNGPYGGPDDERSLWESWRSFYATIADRGIGLAEGPPREVYLQGPLEHGQESSKYVTELQEYLLLPRWLKRMADGIDRLVGEACRRRVMSGSETLTPFSSPQEIALWVRKTMNRLDAAVDEETRREIMAGCAHVFPEERIQQLKSEYRRLENIDKLLELMGRDRSLGEHSYYGSTRRAGRIIYETKNPQNPKGYEETTDENEKRAYYCHCPIIKAIIRSGEQMSPTFCYCGSGWYQRLWKGILGQPVRVEVIQTVLQGNKSCLFAVHLPQNLPIAEDT